MKNSADLGACYTPRPLPLVDNIQICRVLHILQKPTCWIWEDYSHHGITCLFGYHDLMSNVRSCYYTLTKNLPFTSMLGSSCSPILCNVWQLITGHRTQLQFNGTLSVGHAMLRGIACTGGHSHQKRTGLLIRNFDKNPLRGIKILFYHRQPDILLVKY